MPRHERTKQFCRVGSGGVNSALESSGSYVTIGFVKQPGLTGVIPRRRFADYMYYQEKTKAREAITLCSCAVLTHRAEYCDKRVCVCVCVSAISKQSGEVRLSRYQDSCGVNPTGSDRGARSIAMSMSVCVFVFVCPRSYLRYYTSDLHQFLCMLPMAVARSSSGGVVICYALPVLWTTSYLLISRGCSTSS